jgi:hypothetical protein
VVVVCVDKWVVGTTRMPEPRSEGGLEKVFLHCHPVTEPGWLEPALRRSPNHHQLAARWMDGRSWSPQLLVAASPALSALLQVTRAVDT